MACTILAIMGFNCCTISFTMYVDNNVIMLNLKFNNLKKLSELDAPCSGLPHGDSTDETTQTVVPMGLYYSIVCVWLNFIGKIFHASSIATIGKILHTQVDTTQPQYQSVNKTSCCN